MNFKDLKKASSTNIQNLIGELEKSTKRASYIDDRYWSMALDEKTGNGTALIRFLPVCKGDKIPWVELYTHGFQGPGGWYIENSLTTIGKPDPVSEMNTELWNTGIDANKDIVRKRKRKKSYISNILVLSDPKNPQNEGKVFLWKYGGQVFKKIQEKIRPEFEGEEAVDIFDLWKGANFRLKVRKEAYGPNYESSFFEGPGALFNGDEVKLEALWNSQYSLGSEVAEDKFKSYDELQARLTKVLGNKPAASSAPSQKMKEAPAPKFNEEKVIEPAAKSAPWEEDKDDDAMAYFKNLDEE